DDALAAGVVAHVVGDARAAARIGLALAELAPLAERAVDVAAAREALAAEAVLLGVARDVGARIGDAARGAVLDDAQLVGGAALGERAAVVELALPGRAEADRA